MSPSHFARHRYLVFVVVLFSVPWVVHQAKLAVDSNSNRVEDWLPESFDETKKLLWFASKFSTDDILMVSWQDCTIDDPRLQSLADRLRQPSRVAGRSGVILFRQVVTSSEALHELTEPPLDLTKRQALQRIRGWLVGKDGQTGCVVLLLSHDGFVHRHATVDHVYACAAELDGVAAEDVHVAGTSLDSVAIDNASNHGLVAMTIASFAVCSVLMFLLFRSFLLAAIVFLDALFCQQISLALVHVSGDQMDSVLMMLPCIVFVLSVSVGVHLVNYYREASREIGSERATVQAVKDAITPCALASMTTALGLVSLACSVLTPIRKFGLYAAIALCISTVILFLLLPSQLEQYSRWFVGRTPPRRAQGGNRVWGWLTPLVARNYGMILLGTLLLLVASGWGLTQVRTSAGIHNMFRDSARIMRDYAWLEEAIGPLVPLEIVLKVPKSQLAPESTMLDRLKLVGQVHQAVRKVDGIGAVVSAMNFAPPLPGAGDGVRQIAQRTVYVKHLQKNRDTLSETAMYRDDPDEELWRISARAFAGQDLDYSELLARLSATVSPVLAKNDDALGGVSAVFCGGVPLVQKAQDQMLVDLVISFLVAFGMIAIVMVALMVGASLAEFRQAKPLVSIRIVAHRTIAGLLAMIPNVLPCIAVLGLMGIADSPLEIGSILTASVALGVAVDDTLHFTTWFRRGLIEGRSRAESVMFAYQRCGTAMLQTSLICGLGLLVYAVSPFMPMSRFAWLMFAMLTSALLSDLIVLPAILISPLGRFFEPVVLPTIDGRRVHGMSRTTGGDRLATRPKKHESRV